MLSRKPFRRVSKQRHQTGFAVRRMRFIDNTTVLIVNRGARPMPVIKGLL